MDSLALALRGAFRPEKARGPKRLYEVRIDGKRLRIGVKGGKVSVPALSPEDPVEPDLVVEIAPGVLSQLLNGAVDVDAAIESGRVQLDGDRAEARRLFEMFRFPSAEDATADQKTPPGRLYGPQVTPPSTET